MCIRTLIGSVIVATICLAVGTQAVAQSKIYWTTTGTIERANLDGSGVEVLVTTRLGGFNGIALDVAGGKMYWIAGRAIQRANLDGSGDEDLVTGLSRFFGIALDVAGGTMYWTNEAQDKIQRASLDGSGVEDLVTGLMLPRDIALDVAGGTMYWADADKIRRASLDGSGVEDLVTGLGGLIGIALDVAGGKIYWTDIFTDKIQRASLDGSGVEDLVTGVGSPTGIALDVAGGKIYWGAGRKIRRANLDGSGVEDLLVTLGRAGPAGIALDLEDLDGGGPDGGGGGASDITWNVTGVDVDLVVCKNKTIGQKGRIDMGMPNFGSCADLGLAWDSGSKIQIKAVGTVTSVAEAGGSVTGIAANLVVCKNRSTDPREKVRIEDPPSPWNCTDEGLARNGSI